MTTEPEADRLDQLIAIYRETALAVDDDAARAINKFADGAEWAASLLREWAADAASSPDALQRLADLIEPALREVAIRLGPNALAMLQRGEQVGLSGGEYADLARAAARAIIHRHDPAGDDHV